MIRLASNEGICIEKIKNKTGKIVEYSIVLPDRSIWRPKVYEAKHYLANRDIRVRNMKLTSDERILIRKTEDNFMPKEIVRINDEDLREIMNWANENSEETIDLVFKSNVENLVTRVNKALLLGLNILTYPNSENTNNIEFAVFLSIKTGKMTIEAKNDFQITSEISAADVKKGIFENTKIRSVDFRGIKAYNFFSMDAMFSGCRTLEYVNFEGFDLSHIFVARKAFQYCGLHEVDFSGINFDQLTDMQQMFNACPFLRRVSFKNCKLQYVNCVNNLFNSCDELEEVDFSNVSFSSLENMDYMFRTCQSLKRVFLDGVQTPKLKSIFHTFAYCASLEELDLSSFDKRKLEVATSTFQYCDNLKYINLGNCDMPNLADLTSTFENCERLSDIVFTNLSMPNLNKAKGTFKNTSIHKLEVYDADLSNLSTAKEMFQECTELETITIRNCNFRELITVDNIFNNNTSLRSVEIVDCSFPKLKDCANAFSGCNLLFKAIVRRCNLESVTDIDSLFLKCINLEAVELLGITDKSLESAKAAFGFCRKLKVARLDNLKIENVECTGIFGGCNEKADFYLKSFYDDKCEGHHYHGAVNLIKSAN